MTVVLPPAVRRDLWLGWVLQVAAALAVAYATGWGVGYVALAAFSTAAALWFVVRSWGGAAVHRRFGQANRVTLARLSLAMLLAAAVFELPAEPDGPGGPRWLPWALLAVATVAALLDAVDGPLARRSGLASAFGARFDMETDAWLTLVLSLLVWRLDRAGPWVLAAGGMRYSFVAAAWRWPWLAAPLPPRRRRQAACVAQIVLLIVALAPLWSRGASSALCTIGLVLLAASFGIDIHLLRRQHSLGLRHAHCGRGETTTEVAPLPSGRWPAFAYWLLRFLAAGFVLNTFLTFESYVDGSGVHWSPRLSFELCLGVLALMAWLAWHGPGARLGRRGALGLAGLCTTLALVRYVDVTVPAFFGRPVNLYWDAPHAWQLVMLAWSTWSPWSVIGTALGAALVLAIVLAASRWAVATLAECLRARRARPWLAGIGLVLCVSFAVDPFVGADTRWFFSLPLSPTLARQAVLLGNGLARERSEANLTPSPKFAEANLDALRRADVLLLFAESYGITTFDQQVQRDALQAPRERLLRALAGSGQQMVSARVRSPTFGGGSWLAHAALLSGVDTADPNDYDLLLTTRRPTLVTHFAEHGYRTVGWMPGIQRPWPEGSFYGFDRLANADGVGYLGPVFGYWRIPDQASLALLQAEELAAPPAGTTRSPRFVVFPTLDTHAPFHPLAPYREQWERLLGAEAYAAAEVTQALEASQPSGGWVNAYLRATAQTFDWLGEYLAEYAPANLVTIVIGDHQPLATVAGPNASWDVPVHIVSRDAVLLERLRAVGFASGLEPGVSALGSMHELTGLLVRAFDVPRIDVAGTAAAAR